MQRADSGLALALLNLSRCVTVLNRTLLNIISVVHDTVFACTMHNQEWVQQMLADRVGNACNRCKDPCSGETHAGMVPEVYEKRGMRGCWQHDLPCRCRCSATSALRYHSDQATSLQRLQADLGM